MVGKLENYILLQLSNMGCVLGRKKTPHLHPLLGQATTQSEPYDECQAAIQKLLIDYEKSRASRIRETDRLLISSPVISAFDPLQQAVR